ncbi:hypothetical protein ACJQWK_02902 [Exserohilum turcicum]
MYSLLRSKHKKARNELRIAHTSSLAEWSAEDEMQRQTALPALGCECTSLCQPRLETDNSAMLLRHALDRAMERYEDERTSTLVRNEYEVLEIGECTPWLNHEDSEYEMIEK